MSDPVFRSGTSGEYLFDEGCYILEMFNGLEDPHCSIVQARVAPGVTTDWHRLRGTWERYVILRGTGEAFVGDGTPRAVETGDVVLIPPMVAQRIRNTADDDLVFLAVCTPRFEAKNYLPGR